MDNDHKVYLYFCAALVLLVGIACWQKSREQIAQTKGEVKVQEQAVVQAQQHIDQTGAADQAYRRHIQQQQAALTPLAALEQLQAHLPKAEIQTEQVVLADKLPEETREKLPESSSYLCLSDDQRKAIASEQLSCDADRHTLAARESDVMDLHTQLAARTAEAAAWERTAKGGSKWQRFGRVLKYTACAAGGAGLGALASKQLPSAPALGAAVGVTGCSLL